MNDILRNESGCGQDSGNLPESAALDRVLADAKWTHEQQNKGALEEYEGEYIAVFDQQIVAHDRQYKKVHKKAVKQRPDIPPTWFSITYVDKAWPRVEHFSS